ncbi:Glyceraldehyde-3-phosphate dehydrogenase [Plecturocebus cupreus]
MEKAGAHLERSTKRVISVVSDDTPMLVMDMNHEKYKNSLKIVIHDNSGIVEGLMTTVHAIIATQETWLDGTSGKLWHDDHEALKNIISASTGATKAVGKVISKMNGKIIGMVFHIPTTYVSDVIYHPENHVKYDDIKVVKQELEGPLKGILGYMSTWLSPLTLNVTHSSTFHDGASTALNDHLMRLNSW